MDLWSGIAGPLRVNTLHDAAMILNRNIGLTQGALRTVARCRRKSAHLPDADSWAAQLVLALLHDESLASACLIRLGITRDWLMTGALGAEVALSAANAIDELTSNPCSDDAYLENPDPADAVNDPVGFTEILDRASFLARRANSDDGVTSGHLLLAAVEVSVFVQDGFATRGVTAAQMNEALNPAPPTEWTAITADDELRLNPLPGGPNTSVPAARSSAQTAAAASDQHSAAWRVIDANLNRAREGLRVLEDFARFVANNNPISGELKAFRHDLVLTAQLLPGSRSADETFSEEAMQNRDTIGDVGTENSAPNERQRDSMAHLVTANCRRVQESLRSLEEFGKLLSADFAAAAKQLRYRSYTVEKTLGEIIVAAGAVGASSGASATIDSGRSKENLLISRRAGIGHLVPLERGEGRNETAKNGALAFRQGQAPRIARLESASLYLLITESQCRLPWKAVVEQSLQGGADVLQLREKSLNDRELLRRALWMRDACRNANALFIVNDRPDLAVAAAADGVHVGQEELTVGATRRILLPDQLLGVSTHDSGQVQQAFEEGADMIGVGPVFPSRTKSFDEFPGLPFVQSVAAASLRPWFAIGGICTENIADVITAGARRIAVASAVAGSEDPSGVVREFRHLLQIAQSS